MVLQPTGDRMDGTRSSFICTNPEILYQLTANNTDNCTMGTYSDSAGTCHACQCNNNSQLCESGTGGCAVIVPLLHQYRIVHSTQFECYRCHGYTLCIWLVFSRPACKLVYQGYYIARHLIGKAGSPEPLEPTYPSIWGSVLGCVKYTIDFTRFVSV